MVSNARFQAGLAAITQVELQNLEWVSHSALQSFLLWPKSYFSTILPYRQAHFLSFVVSDRYVRLDYAHLKILCIIIYEMMSVLAGNLTAIVMPKKERT